MSYYWASVDFDVWVDCWLQCPVEAEGQLYLDHWWSGVCPSSPLQSHSFMLMTIYFVWCSFRILPCFSPSFKCICHIIHTQYFHFIHWVKIYYSYYFDPQIFSRFGQWKFLVDGFYVLLTCSHYLSNFLFSGIRYSRLIMLSLPLAKNQPFFWSPGSLVKNGV